MDQPHAHLSEHAEMSLFMQTLAGFQKKTTNQLNSHIDPWDLMVENGTESSDLVLRKLTKNKSQNKSERKNNQLLWAVGSLLLQLN